MLAVKTGVREVKCSIVITINESSDGELENRLRTQAEYVYDIRHKIDWW